MVVFVCVQKQHQTSPQRYGAELFFSACGFLHVFQYGRVILFRFARFGTFQRSVLARAETDGQRSEEGEPVDRVEPMRSVGSTFYNSSPLIVSGLTFSRLCSNNEQNFLQVYRYR
jgi:hypothetical protein